MRFAVIGAGPSGLFAARELVHQGHSVALFESHTKPGGCASFFRRKVNDDRVVFDAGATLLNCLGKDEWLGRLLERYHLPPMEIQRVNQVDFQLGAKKFAIDYHSLEAMVESLSRAFPQDAHILCQVLPAKWKLAAEVFSLLEERPTLPIKSLRDAAQLMGQAKDHLGLDWQWLKGYFRSFEDELKSLKLSDTFIEWVNLNLLITLQCRAKETHPLYGWTAFFFYLNGAYAVSGGMKHFFESLLENFLASPNAKYYKRAKILDYEEQNGGELCLRSDSQRWGPFDCVLSSVPSFNQFAERFSRAAHWEELKPKLWSACVGYFVFKDQPSFSAEPFFVHARFKNPLKDSAYLAGADQEVYFSFSGRNDNLRAPTGLRVCTASVHEKLGLWPSSDLPEYAALKQTVLSTFFDAALEQVFPQSEVVFRDYATPQSFLWYTQRREGSVGGLPLSYAHTFLKAPSQRTHHPKIFQIGDTSFPGQSVYACSIGAIACLEKIFHTRIKI